MPEKKHRNPFEEHINSESFDVSRLDDAPRTNRARLEIQEFLDSLPQPLNHDLWDTELDERQKTICAHLTNELVEQVMRTHHAEELQDLSDEQLVDILTVPVTLAMLAEEHLHEKPRPEPPKPQVIEQPALDHPNALNGEQPIDLSGLREALKYWFRRTRDFFVRLFRRF